jgi:23S rRNA pseudouridine1911/1915/1917 synthase
MPSQNMLPKGKRRQSVKAEYRAQRTLAQDREAALRAAGEFPDEAEPEDGHDTAGDEAESYGGMEGGQGVGRMSPPTGRVIVTSGATGSKVAQEVQSPRRYPAPKVVAEAPEIHVLDDLEPEDGVRSFTAEAAAAGLRLDAYLAKALPDISRARVVLLIDNGQVTVDGEPARGKQKLKGGELIEIEGDPRPAPLNAEPEDLPLTIVYEDEDLAVVDKAAGMMVHAGSGAPEHNRGTLVNALLHHFGKEGLSQLAGAGAGPRDGLRPGIVHRLDKQTSGLLVVAKNDLMHRKLGEMFSERRLRKVYLALVHGWIGPQDEGTIALPISRDLVRRTRMTTRRAGGRSAISHWRVLERIDGGYGKFTLVEVRIETGRTHQIRVHMQALGHPVVGDFLYGAPRRIVPTGKRNVEGEGLSLDRNFLHAAELEFAHPRTGKKLELQSELPAELVNLLERVRQPGGQ